MSKHETFGSRAGVLFAMLRMAVGTGNIWRFPRILPKIKVANSLLHGLHFCSFGQFHLYW
jgi:NSS family neurotransmitter:Na+ symporter